MSATTPSHDKHAGAAPAKAGAVSFGALFGLGALWLLVLLSALAVIHATHRSRQLFNELDQLGREQNRLDVEWGRLLLERGTLASLAEIERQARGRLGLREPTLEDLRVIVP